MKKFHLWTAVLACSQEFQLVCSCLPACRFQCYLASLHNCVNQFLAVIEIVIVIVHLFKLPPTGSAAVAEPQLVWEPLPRLSCSLTVG